MIDAPLALYQTTVPEEWLDYNGHMSEWCYLLLVGDAADAFFRYIGIDESYRAAGHSLYTAETHLHHLRESGRGDRLAVPLQVLDVGPKRLHLFHTVRNQATGWTWRRPNSCRAR
jgi:carnitine 3-dehydrogenase